MNYKKSIILLIALSVFSYQAVAGGDFSEQTVCGVQMDVSGRVVLKTCETWSTKNNCPGGNGWVGWYENESQGGGKGMHAIALAAMMSSQKVMLRIGSDCSGGWDHLTAIRVYK